MRTWYRDAKLGIFVHWGLYSIPAFAERTSGDFSDFMRDLGAMKDTQGRIPYAEWYLNALRVPGSPTAQFHERTYGSNFSYFDFRKDFETAAATVDVARWAEFFASVGARYVVMVARHLDGYPLWPTRVRNPNMPADYRLSRDLVGDVSTAVRAHGLQMGLYYAGGIDWTFTDRPIRTMTDLMRSQSLGPAYAHYADAQWRELIDTYRPSILWNDMGWPAENDPQSLFAHYYALCADGLVNDRWTRLKLPGNRVARSAYLGFVGLVLKAMARAGRSPRAPAPDFHFDFETHEYDVPAEPIARPWELTRGLGKSFGYNAQETAADMMTGTQLIHLLVDVVSKGGNLLINVGPDGRGHIPDIQQVPLRQLGTWLDANGAAIFETRRWSRTGTITTDGDALRFTAKNGVVYLIVLSDRPRDTLIVPNLSATAGSTVRLLGDPRALDWSDVDGNLRISLPALRVEHAYVLSLET